MWTARRVEEDEGAERLVTRGYALPEWRIDTARAIQTARMNRKAVARREAGEEDDDQI